MKSLVFCVAMGAFLFGCSSIESNPLCELFGASCEIVGTSCYADHTNGEERCSPTGTPTQGQFCQTTPDGVALVSGCAEGFGCHLSEENPPSGEAARLRCAQYCRTASGNTECANLGNNFRCCEIRAFYTSGAENAPAGLGMCVANTEFVDNPDCPAE
ncbi:MAG: hypothetical protein R3A47_12525 [Polyangiales bacterium]